MGLFLKNIFGLDIGERSLKLIMLDDKGCIKSYNEVGLPEGVIEKGGVIKDMKVVSEKIKETISTAHGDKVRTNRVNTCLPEPNTFITVMNVAKWKRKKDVKESVLSQIPHYFPLETKDVFVDVQIISKASSSESFGEVLVGASPKSIVNQYVELLKFSNLEVISLQIEAASIVNCLFKDSLKPKKGIPEADLSPQIIIDLGESRSSIIVWDKGVIQLSMSVPLSGYQISKKISKQNKIEISKAENRKKTCGLSDKGCEDVYKIIEKDFSVITDSINKTIKYYYKKTGRTVTKIIGSGGGAMTVNLPAFIELKTGIKMFFGDPFVNLLPLKKQKIKGFNEAIRYTTAIGLALEHTKINKI